MEDALFEVFQFKIILEKLLNLLGRETMGPEALVHLEAEDLQGLESFSK